MRFFHFVSTTIWTGVSNGSEQKARNRVRGGAHNPNANAEEQISRLDQWGQRNKPLPHSVPLSRTLRTSDRTEKVEGNKRTTHSVLELEHSSSSPFQRACPPYLLRAREPLSVASSTKKWRCNTKTRWKPNKISPSKAHHNSGVAAAPLNRGVDEGSDCIPVH